MFKTFDKELYRPEKCFYEPSLDFAKDLPISESKLKFHCFWRVPKEFGRKQVAVLKSIIVAHENKLDDLEINLWSNVDLSQNEYVNQISNFIKIRIWNIESEIKSTILEDFNFDISDNNCYLEGDLFRLLILNKYGGFYVDMDVLVLRDISPLSNFEFLYQWGTSGFNDSEPDIKMNGAIMRLDQNSQVSNELLYHLKRTPPIKDSFVWGTNLYSKLKSDIWVLPGIWFNSEWGYEDTILSPFKKIEKTSLFEGAFTWHWHNRWDEEIEFGSKFQILESLIDQKFKNLT